MSSFAIPQECLYPLGYVVAYRIQTMCETEDTLNEMKASAYEAMALINRSFEQIISAIYRLQTLGVVSDDYVHDQEVIASEIWTKINCHILASVSQRELEDKNHFSRMRISMDKHKKR